MSIGSFFLAMFRYKDRSPMPAPAIRPAIEDGWVVNTRGVQVVLPDFVGAPVHLELAHVTPEQYDLRDLIEVPRLHIVHDGANIGESILYTIRRYGLLERCLGVRDGFAVAAMGLEVWCRHPVLRRLRQVPLWRSLSWDMDGELVLPVLWRTDHALTIVWVPLFDELLESRECVCFAEYAMPAPIVSA